MARIAEVQLPSSSNAAFVSPPTTAPPSPRLRSDILHDTFERNAPTYVVPLLHRPQATTVPIDEVDASDPSCLRDKNGRVYYLQHSLGEGGAGGVQVCTVGQSHEVFAIKRMKISHLDMAYRETFAAAACGSPMTPERLLKSGTHVYMLLPLMCGDCEGNCETLVRSMPRSAREGAALHILADILEQTIELHQHEWVHRDIKPANVLYRGGQAFLADFGLAARANEVIKQGGEIVGGTVAFMAPEVFASLPECARLDAWRHEFKKKHRPVSKDFLAYQAQVYRGHVDDPYATDVWSLGMTCLSLLTANPIETFKDTYTYEEAADWFADYRTWYEAWRSLPHRWRPAQRLINDAFAGLTPPVRQLLLAMLHPTPSRRLGAAAALKRVRELLAEHAPHVPELEIMAREGARSLLRQWQSDSHLKDLVAPTPTPLLPAPAPAPLRATARVVFPRLPQ